MHNRNKTIILNFLPGSGGGGLQNIVSFIRYLSSIQEKEDFFAFVRAGSTEHRLCQEGGIDHQVVSDRYVPRLIAEISLSRIWSNSICFTYWGPPPFLSRRKVKNVIGVALSNLFHPEVNFWGHLNWSMQIYKKLKDIYRFRSIKLADTLIFETEYLMNRAKDMFYGKEMRVIQMAPTSNLVGLSNSKIDTRKYCFAALKDTFKILMLNPSHPNKRQHLLPSIVKELSYLDHKIMIFTTMDQDSYSKVIFDEVEEMEIGHMMQNLGRIPYEDISPLIKECDAMLNVSVLESFTNNVIESWYHGKILIITDAGWSRDACGDGAIYIDPTDAKKSAYQISEVIRSKSKRFMVNAAGQKRFSTYPSMEQKNQSIVNLLRELQGDA